MTKLLLNKGSLVALLFLFGCKDSTTEQSIQDCIVDDNYMCLANIAYVLELDWGNGELWSLPKYMTLGTNEDCIEIEDWEALYGNIDQLDCNYSNTSMIYYPNSHIQLSWLYEECPDTTFLYINSEGDSAMANCNVLNYTLLENSPFDNFEYCCSDLAND